MTFEEYACHVLSQMEVDLGTTPRPTDDLYSGIGLDSMQAFELILITEEVAGGRVAAGEVPPLSTFGDAFNYYRTVVRSASSSDHCTVAAA